MTLNDVKEGSSCRILKVNSCDNIKRRLTDLGLIEGTCVKCMFKSSSEESLAYLIRGAVIALRKEDCKNIAVKV